MSNLSNKEFLLLRAKIPHPFPLTVEGTSMLPILHPGDIVNVCVKENYSVGDILVFFYKEDALLVHRLLKVENGRYFCKGDHAFRLDYFFAAFSCFFESSTFVRMPRIKAQAIEVSLI